MLVLDFLGRVAEKTTILSIRKYSNNENLPRFEDGDLSESFCPYGQIETFYFPLLQYTANILMVNFSVCGGEMC